MICIGCPDLIYCNTHYKQHRDNLNGQLQLLTDRCNEFHEEIGIQTKRPEVHPLLKTIDEWEKSAIAKIKQTAQETREILLRSLNNFIPQVKVQLEELRIQIHQSLDDCGFVDTEIQHWTKELTRLKSILKNPSNFTIKENFTEFISKIRLEKEGK